LRKPKYLVTGAAGFIGSNLVAALAGRGESVRAYDNLATGHWGLVKRVVAEAGLVEPITADIRDAVAMARAMEGIDVVFHHAALGSVPRSVENPAEADEVNVHGTVVVLDSARRAGVRRIIFAASSAAYGDTPTLPKREDMAPRPLSPYAVSKLSGEQYLRVFASLYGMETLSLRYFNVFGPNQLPEGPYAAAIPRFVRAALAGNAINVFGDGEQTRDFCFIANVVNANLLAAASPRKLAGEVVNIAGGRRISLNDLIKEIGRVLEKKLEVQYLDPRPGDVKHSLADIASAKELIGYEPTVTWETGIPPTVEFLRKLAEQGLP
jgi:UDP-glucose 4-epimerase